MLFINSALVDGHGPTIRLPNGRPRLVCQLDRYPLVVVRILIAVLVLLLIILFSYRVHHRQIRFNWLLCENDLSLQYLLLHLGVSRPYPLEVVSDRFWFDGGVASFDSVCLVIFKGQSLVEVLRRMRLFVHIVGRTQRLYYNFRSNVRVWIHNPGMRRHLVHNLHGRPDILMVLLSLSFRDLWQLRPLIYQLKPINRHREHLWLLELLE